MLLLDADDTLWENNIYFERAISNFLSLLDHTPHHPTAVRDRLDTIEADHVARFGYGAATFERSLLRCYEELSHLPLRAGDQARIAAFARSVVDAEVELLPGVADAVARLAGRFQLVLVTKGDHAEQASKLGRSGLAPLFAHVRILREKDAAAYRMLAADLKLNPDETWMVGNSPRSDANPALAAGMHAILVRSRSSWVLEEEPLRTPAPGQRLLCCDSFAEAAAHLLLA
jgi:putative hydrolase of the HAD superfamily